MGKPVPLEHMLNEILINSMYKSMVNSNTVNLNTRQWRIQDFPEEGAPMYYLVKKLLKTA